MKLEKHNNAEKGRVNKKSKTRVLIIVKSIDGGTGTFVLSLMKMSKIFKKSITIQALVLEAPSFRKVVLENSKVFRKKDFYPQHYSLSPMNFLYFLQELLWVKRIYIKSKPNIILSVDFRCNLLAIALKRIYSLNNLKVVATTHIDLGRMLISKSTPWANILLRKVVKLFYANADELITVSRNLGKGLKKEFGLNRKITTIYNGLKLKTSEPIKYRGASNLIYISTLVRLFKQKDTNNLIDAFNILLKRLPNARLWIIGDGPEKSKLKELANKLSIKSKIKFFGWITKPDRLLRKSDLFVLSSHREGFGLVLVEAMAKGIPTISTDTPHGPAEILGNGKYGLLVPMSNPAKLSEAMHKILTNSKIYNHYAKMSVIRSKYFSEKKMLRRYFNLITSLKT